VNGQEMGRVGFEVVRRQVCWLYHRRGKSVVEDEIVEAEITDKSARKTRRRWSKRLVVYALLVVLSMCAGGWVYLEHENRAEVRAYLKGRGYRVYVQEYGWEWYQYLTAKAPLPKFERVVGVDNLHIVNVVNKRALSEYVQPRDEDWDYFGRLPYLSDLAFTGESVRVELEDVAGSLPKLQGLHLNQMKVVASDLRYLASMEELEELTLTSMGLGDDDLAHLAGLGIADLDLSGNPITDAGLIHLASLKRLTKVNFSATRVSHDKAVEVLSKVPDVIKTDKTTIWRVPFMKMPGKVQ